MSSSRDKWWGTSKQSAYIGWFFAVLGGVCIGGGIAIIFIPRLIIEGIMAQNPTVGINPEPYADINLFGAFAIMIGVLLSILAIYGINKSQKLSQAQK